MALSFITQAGFAAIAFIFYGLLLRELKRGMRAAGFIPKREKKIVQRALLALLIWMIVISVLSIQGFFNDFSTFPPKMGIVFIVPLITILTITFSKSLKEILNYIPTQNLIRLQVFRVFVEILIWLLFIQNFFPIQMTFEGRNGDILAGATAPVVAHLVTRKSWYKSLPIIWNIAGLLLLLNIAGVAILSLPTPFRIFMNEPSSTLVTQFPVIWLPGFLVPLAYSLHFFSLRQLLTKKIERSPEHTDP